MEGGRLRAATASATSAPGAKLAALDANDFLWLVPKQSMMVEVRFAPTVAGLRANGELRLSVCGNSSCETVIQVTGLGTN